MQYSLHCKLVEKNNELPTSHFKFFLGGGAGVGKSFLIKAVTEYLKQVPKYPNQNFYKPSVLVTTSTGKSNLLHVSVVLDDILHFVSLLSQDWNPISIKSQVCQVK